MSDFVATLIRSRHNVSPKRLHAPGPDRRELELIFEAAAAAPDHGLLLPWRFVIIPEDKREALGAAFALALADRDPAASTDQIESAREKARRSPLLMLAIARVGSDTEDVPAGERFVSLGCAIQNMLLTAHALGYGAGLTSGRALRSRRIRDLFSLADGEEALCFVNIGMVDKRKPSRARPPVAAFRSSL